MSTGIKNVLTGRVNGLWFVLSCLVLAAVVVGARLIVDQFTGTMDWMDQEIGHPVVIHPAGHHPHTQGTQAAVRH